jgi:hypothetical protein
MAKETEETHRTRQLLAELQEIRKAAARAEAAKRLKKIAAELAGGATSLLATVGGADHARAEAIKAIADLSAGYDRPNEPVPDSLWAQAVNLTHAWANAGRSLDGAD